MKIIIIGLYILVLELLNLIISLPAYVFISPSILGGNDIEAVKSYSLRRTVSLSVLGGVVGLWILKIILVGVLGIGSLGFFSHKVRADSISWNFNNPVAYVYDATKIQIVDGMAMLKAQTVSAISPAITTEVTAIANTTPISLPPVSGTVPATADITASITNFAGRPTTVDTKARYGFRTFCAPI